MKVKFYVIFLVFWCDLLSAQTTISGNVLDVDTGEPLYFATVVVAGQPYGTLTREDGSFDLRTEETLPPETIIMVSYLGYNSVEYQLKDLLKKGGIRLSPTGVGLPVVNVSATEKLREMELGRTERKAVTFYQNNFDHTYQLAGRVGNAGQLAGVLTEVRYFFGKAAKKGKPVRLNFYAVDPACDCPGEPLHATSIIPGKTRSGWNKLDLTDDQVSLPPGDFFIAFEWLGLSTMGTEELDFSVGMVYDKGAAKLYEKKGGQAWAEATARSFYRPLVRVTAKVD